MRKVLVGAGVGAACVLLLAAGLAAQEAPRRGIEWFGRTTFYLGWFSVPVGLALGALAGFGWWLLRRR